MRLVKLTVDAFQCIEHGEVEFGPGLNVLFGPNDLGKSSLASAIRNVLLLPHGSAAHEQLVSWHSGAPPRVALAFSTERQRLWRVTKTFGSGSAGSSQLEFSKDGVSFSKDATAREVDARVRELLRWGISKPGGRGGVKGIPESFLANVLLAEQADVPEILARGLTGDADESGRTRLNEALQALAEDPLFKRVLEAAQRCASEAFTSTGQRSRRQGSPFKDIADEISELQQRRSDLQTKLNETIGSEESLRRLHSELDDVSAQVALAEDGVNAVREAHAQTVARAALENEFRTAEADLEAVRRELAEVEDAARSVEALREEAEAAEQVLAEKVDVASEAASVREEASRRLQEVTSESGAQARQLTIQQAENDVLKTDARRSEVRAAIASAEEAERRVQEAARARQALEDVGARLAEAESAVASRVEAEATAKDALVRHGMVETFARLRDAQRRRDAAEAALADAQSARERAAELRGEAETLGRQVADLDPPDAGVVQALEALARELELAEARLGGGLSVVLTPLKDVLLNVAADGDPPVEHRGRDSIALEAQRSFEIRVDDLVRVAVTAGEEAVRAEVERLRARWDDEGAPVLERAGLNGSRKSGEASPVRQAGALAERRAHADNLLRQIAERRGEAAGLDGRAHQLDQDTEDLERLRIVIADRERALAGQDQAELRASIANLGEAWESALERDRVSAESAVRAASAEAEAGRRALEERKLEHAGCTAASSQAASELEQALAQFPAGVDRTLQERRRELHELDCSHADLSRRIEALSLQAKDEQSEAQRALDAAAGRLAAAEDDVKQGRVEHDRKRDALARASGNLEARRAQAQRLDPVTAAAAVEDCLRRLAAVPAPTIPASEADVAEAERSVERARAALVDKQSEIYRAQGALEQVGGAVVREQLEEIDRALRLAGESEHQIEVEYEAWRLLAETLREVENSDGAHLGKALAGPLGERFAALTGGRYGNLSIGQELDIAAEGVEAAGRLRPVEALSVGTQDQLATLFRLCIAEQLQSSIVLDDHLTQSDPGKIRWFRDLLRQTGQSIQIVVLTCRPEDYLLPDELPGADEVFRDRAAGLFRAIDLNRAIRRYELQVSRNVAATQ